MAIKSPAHLIETYGKQAKILSRHKKGPEQFAPAH